MKRKIFKGLLIGLGVVTLLIAGAVIYLSQTSTSQITDVNGNIVPNSIATFDKVKIGGVEQTILVRGKDKNNPVVLFLHGGPGAPDMAMIRYYNEALEDQFTVVSWDQRGCGKSKFEDASLMNINRFVEDAHELTGLLKERFKQNKILLVGHSWGSVLGLKLIDQYPNDYFAYVGIGQVVNLAASEKISYDFLKEAATKDETLQEALAAIPAPVNGRYEGGTSTLLKQRELLLKAGGVMKAHKDYTPMVDAYMKTREVGLLELFAMNKHFKFSVDNLWEELTNINFAESIKSVKVPTYFLVGEQDYITHKSVSKSYYEQLEAPIKEFIEISECGHFPYIEKNKLFQKYLYDIKEAHFPESLVQNTAI